MNGFYKITHQPSAKHEQAEYSWLQSLQDCTWPTELATGTTQKGSPPHTCLGRSGRWWSPERGQSHSWSWTAHSIQADFWRQTSRTLKSQFRSFQSPSETIKTKTKQKKKKKKFLQEHHTVCALLIGLREVLEQHDGYCIKKPLVFFLKECMHQKQQDGCCQNREKTVDFCQVSGIKFRQYDPRHSNERRTKRRNLSSQLLQSIMVIIIIADHKTSCGWLGSKHQLTN